MRPVAKIESPAPGTAPADPHEHASTSSGFLRGLAIGALAGGVIAGSMVRDRRRRSRAVADPPVTDASAGRHPEQRRADNVDDLGGRVDEGT